MFLLRRPVLLCAVLMMQAASAASTSVVMSGMTPTLGGDIVQKQVSIKFEDPSDSQGAAALYARLDRIAGKLCASNTGGTNALLAEKIEKCRLRALSQAVKDIDRPELTAAARK